MRLLNKPTPLMYGVKGSSLDLSCRLTDPSVNVTLWRGTREKIPDGNSVTKSGQVFSLHDLKSFDASKEEGYECRVPSSYSIGAVFPIGHIVRVFSKSEWSVML